MPRAGYVKNEGTEYAQQHLAVLISSPYLDGTGLCVDGCPSEDVVGTEELLAGSTRRSLLQDKEQVSSFILSFLCFLAA